MEEKKQVNSGLQTQQIFSMLKDLSPRQKEEILRVLNRSDEDSEPIPLCGYLEEFWNFEKSRYLMEERAYGRHISARHCKENERLVGRYWLPYFGEEFTVQDLTKNALEDFLLDLRLNKRLAGATVNHVLTSASPAFRYLKKKGKISFNPLEQAERFEAKPRMRGIPTEDEIRRLLSVEWLNRSAFLAFNLAAFFGLRAGEICALRTMDLNIRDGVIQVRHSWNELDGIKPTKNGEERDIPCPKEMLYALFGYARLNPLFSKTSFVLWSESHNDRPCSQIFFLNNFYSTLKKIGISKEQRRERNIVFHSLRHFCATVLSSHTSMPTVQQILGHKSPVITQHYSAHSSEEKMMAQKAALEECREYIKNTLDKDRKQ